MNHYLGLILLFNAITTGLCIRCFRCNSTQTLDCLEKFLNPNPLKAESCNDIYEARYCIKTTGIFDGEVGTQRFCSAKDLGNFCMYYDHHDGRRYRGCVYTCGSDECNAATRGISSPPSLFLLSVVISVVIFCVRSMR